MSIQWKGHVRIEKESGQGKWFLKKKKKKNIYCDDKSLLYPASASSWDHGLRFPLNLTLLQLNSRLRDAQLEASWLQLMRNFESSIFNSYFITRISLTWIRSWLFSWSIAVDFHVLTRMTSLSLIQIPSWFRYFQDCKCSKIPLLQERYRKQAQIFL